MASNRKNTASHSAALATKMASKRNLPAPLEIRFAKNAFPSPLAAYQMASKRNSTPTPQFRFAKYTLSSPFSPTQMASKRKIAHFTLLLLLLTCLAQSQTPTNPPGTVIDHEPESSNQFIGSPSLAVLPNGAYVASHDLFGPASAEKTSGLTRIFISNDKGRTWQQTAELHDQFWSTLFVHHRQLYLMGTSAEYGRIVIRRATDNTATTWTPPSFLTTDAGLSHGPRPLSRKKSPPLARLRIPSRWPLGSL
jgi:hypothetical protein